ncbi:MAG: hypothetical protein ACXVZR_08335 [Terriglobales bacterium]
MRDDEREEQCDRDTLWRIEVELPEPMVRNFRQWWEAVGWWSFRAWHEQQLNADSEWENFMRQLYGEAPAKKRPRICDPLNPLSD